MLHRILLSSLGIILSGSTLSAQPKCPLLAEVIELGFPPKGNTEDYTTVYGMDPGAALSRLKLAESAALKTLKDAVPSMLEQSYSEKTKFFGAWEASFSKVLKPFVLGTRENPLILNKIREQSELYEVNIEGKVRVFRSGHDFDSLIEARNAIAVSILNDFFGFDTVPITKPAIINGTVGSIRNYIEGKPFHQFSDIDFLHPLAKALRTGEVSADAFDDAAALMFLISNRDATAPNIFVTKSGRLKIFDLGIVFQGHMQLRQKLRLEFSIFDRAPLGYLLPRSYNSGFVKRLNSLDRDKMEDLLLDHLSNEEISGLMLNREILLRDIESNPELIKQR